MDASSLRVLSANVRGFRTNVGELTHTFVLKNSVDVVVAVETFLDDRCVTTCDRIPGFSHWIRRDRQGGQGGGIAVCHRNTLQVDALPVDVPEALELLFLRIILEDRSALLLCAAYRPQWQGNNPLHYLTDQIDRIMITHNCQNVLIVGDLNQHLVERAFTELTVVHGLHNHVNFPTHERGGSLDPVLTDLPDDRVQCRPLDRVGSSDHFAVLSTLNLAPSREEDYQRDVWLWERAEWEAARLALTAVPWDTVLTGDPDRDAVAFTQTLHSIQQQFVPRRTFTANPKDQPWFGYRCRIAAERKYTAWTTYKRHPTHHNKALHRQACKDMTRTSKWAKKRWEDSLKRKLTSNQSDPKQWWSLVKDRQGVTFQERIPALRKPDGELAITSQAKADLLAHAFSQKMKTQEPERRLPTLPRISATSLDGVVITEEAVMRHLKGINTKKAPGPDDVSPHLLRRCAAQLTRPLTFIFRHCLQHGVWPSLWKEARVTPVHKKSLRSEPGNYRPISLLSVVSKIFERIIGEQLTAYLEEHHLLSPRQYGFRKGRSTSDLLLLLSKSWHDSLDSGRPSLVIALDIAGAFDCVWHKGLMAKLQQLGITGDLLGLLSSYLTDRSLRVVVNGHTSTSFPVEASVPQGSVIGPLLWNAYFDDLLHSTTAAAAYADDCTLSWTFKRDEAREVIESVNRQLADILAWGERWQVKFAPEKTQAMVISRSRQDADLLRGKLRLGRDTITLQDSVDILGVEVDSGLRFDRHLKKVALAASRRVTLMRRMKHLLDADGLTTLYKAQVRPVMEYAPLTWMASARCHLNLLEKIQRRAERLIRDAPLPPPRQQQEVQQQQQHQQQQQRQQQHHDNHPVQQMAAAVSQLDSLDHRRRVAALTTLHKANIQHVPALTGLVVPRRRSERSTRTVLCNDSLLEVPRSHTSTHQRAFTTATVEQWNSFTADVDVRQLSTQQVKVAAHRWLLLHPP